MKRQKSILGSMLAKNAKRLVSALLVLALISALYVPSSIAPTPSNTVDAHSKQLDDTVETGFHLTSGVLSIFSDMLTSLDVPKEDSTPLSGICNCTGDLLNTVSVTAKESEIVGTGYEEETLDEMPEEEPVVYNMQYVAYTTDNLNVRSAPDATSSVAEVLPWNAEVWYDVYDDEWAIISYNDTYAYVNRAYLTNEQVTSTYMDVYGDSRKSYMDYRTITAHGTRQLTIQENHAYTEWNGVRAVRGRYLIALGSYYTHDNGRYVDVYLANGTVIPAIIGDCKRNRDTNSNNSIGADGGVAEFIVDESVLNSTVRLHGDVSYSTDGWNSKVVGIRIYNKNLFY